MIGRALAAIIAALGPLAPATPGAAAAECELSRPIVFGDLDWDSNRFHTALARAILERGYGCRSDSIPGSTIPLVVGLGRGDVDVIMEIWKDNVTEAWEQAEAAGTAFLVGVNFPDSRQGWFVPRYLVEGDPSRGIAAAAPDLRHVSDLPRYKELFRDPEEPSKGRFYNCVLGWNCEVVNTRKLAAYGLDRHFTNFRPGAGAALAATIASHYARGRPILAYYWGPTWVLAKYDLLMLEEPPYNEADWRTLGDADPSAEVRPVAYPPVAVYVAANAEFARAAPAVVRFLERYETTSAMVGEALLYLHDHPDANADAAALWFLRTRAPIWRDWVPPAVAARIADSLR